METSPTSRRRPELVRQACSASEWFYDGELQMDNATVADLQLHLRRVPIVGPFPFDELPETTRRYLQQCCQLGPEETSKIYTELIKYYDYATRSAAISGEILGGRLQERAHGEVQGFLCALQGVVDRYQALTHAERNLALAHFVNPEMDSEAAREGVSVVNEDHLPTLMADLQQLHSRLALRRGSKRGSPSFPDWSRSAIAVCRSWQALGGDVPTWNDKGNGGLREFHELASRVFDVEYVGEMTAADGSQLAPVHAQYLTLRAATGRALRDGARYLRRAK